MSSRLESIATFGWFGETGEILNSSAAGLSVSTGNATATRRRTGGAAAGTGASSGAAYISIVAIGTGESHGIALAIKHSQTSWSSVSSVTEVIIAILEEDDDLCTFRAGIRGDGTPGATERRIFPPYVDPDKHLFAIEESGTPYMSVSPIEGDYLTKAGDALNSDTQITRRVVCIMPRNQYPAYGDDADMKQAYILTHRALFGSGARARLEAAGVDNVRSIRVVMNGLTRLTPQPAFALDLGLTVKGERLMA